MARKNRLQVVSELPENKPQEQVFYQDAFQTKATKQIGELSKKVEGKGRSILWAILGVVGLVLVGSLVFSLFKRSGNAGQAALGNAIETSLAPVTTQPIPPTYTGKSFKSDKERAEAAVAEFDNVANSYGGDIGQKAKYFSAVNKINIDRNAAETDLDALNKNGGAVGSLAKFALAQAKQGDGKFDEAAALYQELLSASDPIIAKDTINSALASIFEKQGKSKEAADIYFQIADAASKAKDSDGKAMPMSQTATEAKDKLQTLDPARAATIKVETPEFPS